jgi:hypothetical protein
MFERGVPLSSERYPRPTAAVVARVALLVAGVGVASIALLAAAPRQRLGGSGPDLTSAEECGRCHQDIHRYWKSSVHAQSADNSRFQEAFARAKASRSSEPGCLTCHAPAAVYMHDTRWEKKTSWEGVTCDFCHSVRGIHAGTDRPFVLDPGRIKTGPLKDARPTVHEAAYSDVYESSTLCAPCHQYTNEKKFDVLTTYAEWQAGGFAARQVSCQACHMRAAAGNVVDPKVARSATISVNVHDMPGGHSVTELNRALQAQISAERNGDALDVTVQVTNRGAGHKVPTGSPLRAILMVVEADNGIGSRRTATRTFGRTVVDESGRDLQDEAAVFERAAKVVSDNRLAPGERHVEHFSFPMPRTAPARAVARFYYRYAPEAAGRVELGLPFLSVSAWVDVDRK